jgi:hypothetical protein
LILLRRRSSRASGLAGNLLGRAVEQIGVKEIKRLIKKLELDKEILAEQDAQKRIRERRPTK